MRFGFKKFFAPLCNYSERRASARPPVPSEQGHAEYLFSAKGAAFTGSLGQRPSICLAFFFPDDSPAFQRWVFIPRKSKSRQGRKKRVLFAEVNRVAWFFRPWRDCVVWMAKPER